MKKLFFAIAISFSALFANQVSLDEYKKTFETFSKEEIMKMMVEGVGKLPQRLDEITTLNEVKPNGDVLEYNYILNDTNTTKLGSLNDSQKNAFYDIMHNQVGTEICKNNAVLAVLDRDIKFGYNYKLENGKEFIKFIYSKKECANFK